MIEDEAQVDAAKIFTGSSEGGARTGTDCRLVVPIDPWRFQMSAEDARDAKRVFD